MLFWLIVVYGILGWKWYQHKMSLQNQVNELKASLNSASTLLCQLDDESKEAIGAEIVILHSALRNAAQETFKLIKESTKSKNLLLFRTEKAIANKINNQLGVVIRSLDISIASSDRVLQLSMHHVKEVDTFKNEHISPARQKIVQTITRVEHTKRVANAELTEKRTEMSKAESELRRTATQLESKQRQISSNTSDLLSKQSSARRLEERQREHERQARRKEAAARAAEQEAERRRDRAAWMAFIPIVGWGVAIADIVEARSLDSQATECSSDARSSASLASSLRSTCSSIESQIRILESESRSLESEKRSLEWRKQAHERDVGNLERRVTTLNQEVLSATSLRSDLNSIDAQTEQLAETTRLLGRSLQQLKADISECVDFLTEKRDYGQAVSRKANRGYITEEKKLEILRTSTKKILPQIRESQKVLPGFSQH